MRLRGLLTLRKPADVAAEAQATEERTLAPLDARVIESREVLAHYRETLPHAFDDRRSRRAGDRADDGLEVVDSTGIIKGNDDIVCERGGTRLPPFELDHKGGQNRGGAL